MPKAPNAPNAIQLNYLADHTPSQKMVVADTLSRSPLEFEAEPDTVEDVQAFRKLGRIYKASHEEPTGAN